MIKCVAKHCKKTRNISNEYCFKYEKDSRYVIEYSNNTFLCFAFQVILFIVFLKEQKVNFQQLVVS